MSVAIRDIAESFGQRAEHRLSPCETDVFHLWLEGYDTREIAQMLHRSLGTVRTQRARVMKKLDLRAMQQVVPEVLTFVLEGDRK